jgi:3-hydroxyisobutyrate dehydrogenase-like beta-hydroxyacid dehydrogenase
VSGTPGMVAARKAVIYLAGDKDAAGKVERVVGGFADSCLYFGPFGAASRVKLVITCSSPSTSPRQRRRWRSASRRASTSIS